MGLEKSPIRAVMDVYGVTDMARFARALGISEKILRAIDRGVVAQISAHHREAFERLGIDFDQLRAEYGRWRDVRLGLPVDTLNDGHPLKEAIEKGVRGVQGLSFETGLSQKVVRELLRGGES